MIPLLYYVWYINSLTGKDAFVEKKTRRFKTSSTKAPDQSKVLLVQPVTQTKEVSIRDVFNRSL